jgi:hypothetical protein
VARCIFCDEWAGPESNYHERCARDLARQMAQPSLTERILSGAKHALHAAYAGLFGTPHMATVSVHRHLVRVRKK